MIHWFLHYTGSDNLSGPWYGFWSGFGSDIGEVTLVTMLLGALRHRNCHVKGCLRMGKPVEGTAFLACHIHHPDHPGSKRNVTLHQLEEVAGVR